MADLPPSPSRRSWGRILLIVALAVSLLGNALTLGGLIRLRELREELVGSDVPAVTLPADLRDDLRTALRERRGELFPSLRQLVQARRAMVTAMKAKPHDRAKTEAAIQDFRNSLDALLGAMQVIVLDRLDQRTD